MGIRMRKGPSWAVGRQERSESGFTLIEVLIAMGLVLIVLVSLAPAVVHALLVQKEAQSRWQQAVECWNRVQLIRAGEGELEPQPGTESIGGASLRRYRVVVSTGESLIAWEVLDASQQRIHAD